MGLRLYVGNLAWSVTESQLREAFSRWGEIKDVKVVMDRETGRSRGFGFVEYSRSQDGFTAMEKMGGFELAGRPLKVNEAKART